MSDQRTTLQQLKERMAAFVRERDWEQFHDPKNLSMAIAIEAAELMEHFQWLTTQQAQQLSAAALQEVGEELADVLLYSLSLANCLQLDLTETVTAKLAKNECAYPRDQVRGKAHKYTHYRQQEKL